MSDDGKLSLCVGRWLGRLRPPTTEPAAMVWAAFDEAQRIELLRSAADVRHATVPDRAVVPCRWSWRPSPCPSAP